MNKWAKVTKSPTSAQINNKSGHEIRKIWRWPKMATARVSAVAMATAKLAQQKWALLKWSLIQRSLHQFLNYWKAFWMGFIEFTKMAITSLKIGHFHPDFAQLRWPILATVGLSGGGHCGGQLAWPPRISRPEYKNVFIKYPYDALFNHVRQKGCFMYTLNIKIRTVCSIK